MMNHRQVKTVLWSASGLLGCAAVAVVAWGVAAPLKIEPRVDHPAARRGSQTDAAADVAPDVAADAAPDAMPPLEQFSAVWRKPVRGVLFADASPPPTASKPESPAPPPPPLRVKLLATAIEDGRSCAVLLNEENLIEVKRVGEFSGGAKIVRIESDRVELQHHGRNVTLTTPQADAAPGPSAPTAAAPRRRRP